MMIIIIISWVYWVRFKVKVHYLFIFSWRISNNRWGRGGYTGRVPSPESGIFVSQERIVPTPLNVRNAKPPPPDKFLDTPLILHYMFILL